MEKVVWLVCWFCLSRERISGEDGIAVEMGMSTSPWQNLLEVLPPPKKRGLVANLCSCEKSAPICTPAQRERLAANIKLAHEDLGARIPKPYTAIRGTARQLEFSNRVEQDFFNGMAMSPQLGLATRTRALRVPYPNRLVIGARCD